VSNDVRIPAGADISASWLATSPDADRGNRQNSGARLPADATGSRLSPRRSCCRVLQVPHPAARVENFRTALEEI
jgi:hypothetical protein